MCVTDLYVKVVVLSSSTRSAGNPWQSIGRCRLQSRRSSEGIDRGELSVALALAAPEARLFLPFEPITPATSD